VQLRNESGETVIVKLDEYKDGAYNYESEIDRFVGYLTDEGGDYEGYEYIVGSGIIKTGTAYWDENGSMLSREQVVGLGYKYQSKQTVEVDVSILENIVPPGPASYAPISIDLDGDDVISYLNLDAGIEFDFGAGLLPTAWVAPEDGLLVYDFDGLLATAKGDGVVATAGNIVLTMWAEGTLTDMEALALYFDTNQDGIFNAEDNHWHSFGVWQDSISNGLIDEGEFQALNYYGIAGLELNYTDKSAAFKAADSGVNVYGQFNVKYDDGSIGMADDMAFVQTSTTEDDTPAKLINTELAVLADGDSEIAIDDEGLSIGTNGVESVDNKTDIGELVANYLETINSQEFDSQNKYASAELACALDEVVSDYIESNGISIGEYALIQEDVLKAIDNDFLNDFDSDVSGDFGADEGGLSMLSSANESPVELEINAEIANTKAGGDYIGTGAI